MLGFIYWPTTPVHILPLKNTFHLRWWGTSSWGQLYVFSLPTGFVTLAIECWSEPISKDHVFLYQAPKSLMCRNPLCYEVTCLYRFAFMYGYLHWHIPGADFWSPPSRPTCMSSIKMVSIWHCNQRLPSSWKAWTNCPLVELLFVMFKATKCFSDWTGKVFCPIRNLPGCAKQLFRNGGGFFLVALPNLPGSDHAVLCYELQGWLEVPNSTVQHDKCPQQREGQASHGCRFCPWTSEHMVGNTKPWNIWRTWQTMCIHLYIYICMLYMS